MIASDTVRKIGFTGSTGVGKKLAAGAADTVKRVSLELGGNAPFIIFDDADVETAAQMTVSSAFRNAGQTCICASRIFVQVSCQQYHSLVYLIFPIDYLSLQKNGQFARHFPSIVCWFLELVQMFIPSLVCSDAGQACP